MREGSWIRLGRKWRHVADTGWTLTPAELAAEQQLELGAADELELAEGYLFRPEQDEAWVSNLAGRWMFTADFEAALAFVRSPS